MNFYASLMRLMSCLQSIQSYFTFQINFIHSTAARADKRNDSVLQLDRSLYWTAPTPGSIIAWSVTASQACKAHVGAILTKYR